MRLYPKCEGGRYQESIPIIVILSSAHLSEDIFVLCIHNTVIRVRVGIYNDDTPIPLLVGFLPLTSMGKTLNLLMDAPLATFGAVRWIHFALKHSALVPHYPSELSHTHFHLGALAASAGIPVGKPSIVTETYCRHLRIILGVLRQNVKAISQKKEKGKES